MSHFNAKEFVHGDGSSMTPFESVADLDAKEGPSTVTHGGRSFAAPPAFTTASKEWTTAA